MTTTMLEDAEQRLGLKFREHPVADQPLQQLLGVCHFRYGRKLGFIGQLALAQVVEYLLCRSRHGPQYTSRIGW